MNTIPWEQFKAMCRCRWTLFTHEGWILDAEAADGGPDIKEDNNLVFKTMGDNPEGVYVVLEKDNPDIHVVDNSIVIVYGDDGVKHEIRFLDTVDDIATDTRKDKMVMRLEIRCQTLAELDEAWSVASGLVKNRDIEYHHRQNDSETAELTIELETRA